MAKKETVKLTPEGLRLLTVMGYSGIADMNGFYAKEVFFTEGFAGDKSLLYQALGNIGSFSRDSDLDKDISIIILSNQMLDGFDNGVNNPFINLLEEKLNQNNSPYRRMRFISEDHLVWYLENRININNDKQLKNLISKYKSSKKENNQLNFL